jgi:hypothetical protein
MILHKLERLDAKIDRMSSEKTEERPSSSVGVTSISTESPASLFHDVTASKATPISFSAHLMIDWPAVRRSLPSGVDVPDGGYALRLEDTRPGLAIGLRRLGEDLLSSLSISTVRELSDAYFATFNLATPVLDRQLYFQRTLGGAIHGGFDYDADSCVVLMTMALGCFGKHAMLETSKTSPHYHVTPSTELNFHTNSDHGGLGDIPGLMFYNEARKRIGFLESQHNMQITQFYLLAATYCGQLTRPVDCWSMTMRAGIGCLKFWQSEPCEDEWTLDMYSRLFWITVTYDTVLTQELIGLPSSKVRDMEDQVPLPKFVRYSQALSAPTQQDDQDDSSHYHFLSQIAHRIFLTRVYTTSYFSSKSFDQSS